MTPLPQIGETITTQRALELCKHFSFDHLVKRLETDSDRFKSWEFDGCSMIPDKIASKLIGVPTLTEICLRHDLGYAYGEPKNKEERLKVDFTFGIELLEGGASASIAQMMFEGVRIGGGEFGMSFSWAFARK